ncbi:putative quinol monooxygenase [Niallia taxi]|uniref:putative quinol monooxygenase n=1 Tax=Niallia taxi TaxID=2499688 RepID=UPI003172F85B
MFVIHAKMKLQEGKEAAFLEEVCTLVKASREEEGNISYQLVKSVEEENTFIMIEGWKDQAAIEQHNASSHFQGFVSKAGEYLAAPLEAEVFQAEKLAL